MMPTQTSRDDTSFEQTILANLRAAGIQNGRKNERLTFDSVETYAGSYIQAVGERRGRSRRSTEAGRHHDRPAVRDGRAVVHQGRGAGGESGR